MNDQSNEDPTVPENGGVGTLPPPSLPPARPVFRRHAGDRVVSGVAGGLARTFAVDAAIVRIVVVVLAITFPPAFIAYVIAWFLVARDGEPSSTTVANTDIRVAGGVGFWILGGLLALAAVAALDDPFRGNFDLLPLVLIGVGVALWTRDGNQGTPAPPRPAVGGDQAQPTEQSTEQSTGASTVWPVVAAPRPARPPRPRSPLGAVTLAMALIAAGVVAFLDQIDGVPIDANPTHLAAVALLVLGGGLLVGAVWGRARWLLLVALLLLPPTLGGAAFRAVDTQVDLSTGLDIGDGIGERALILAGQDPLPEDLSLLAGSVTVDLRSWTPDDATRSALDASDEDLVIEVGAGEVIVLPPADVAWRIVGDVGLGELVQRDEFDNIVEQVTSGGPGDPLRVELAGGPPTGPVLDIVVRMNLGELTVTDPSYTQELS